MFQYFEGFHPQYVHILFLVSTKHSYLILAKITSDVNNSL